MSYARIMPTRRGSMKYYIGSNRQGLCKNRATLVGLHEKLGLCLGQHGLV